MTANANYDLQRNVPEILKQRLIELEETSKILIPSKDQQKLTVEEAFDNGRFLLWKGAEIGLFFVTGPICPGSLFIFDYQNGTENAKLMMDYKFGRTAIIIDVIYFPLAKGHRGIVVAVTDRSLEENGNYLAYISLDTKSLLKSFAMPHPITKLCSIIDGTAERNEFTRLASSFHSDWQNMLLVGCRFGYVSLVNLDIDIADDWKSLDYLQNVKDSPSIGNRKPIDENAESTIKPVKLKKNVQLSKIFYKDQMFVFRADDGITRCHPKDKVHVSALYWIAKSGLVVIGFNFGGIMAVSLRTSKVFSLLYIDGMVQQFALQEPEEDPRPLLYFWISYNSMTIGTTLLMCTINFPKDEEAAKKSKEYTFLEPFFSPCMKWNPDNCSRLITMRTINKRHLQGNGNYNDLDSAILNAPNGNSSASIESNKDDTSLLFISWLEPYKKGNARIHGALFDLNAFYAKRLIPRIQPDTTIARQFPFIARFTSIFSQNTDHSQRGALLDINPIRVCQFAPPAFLSETIDQLYYPSTYHLTLNCLSFAKVYQAKVQPIQVQLICDLVKNVPKYFDSPHEPVRWIHAIGLANSAPSNNINEERACLLRVIVHSFFPGILSLIDSAAEQPECLRFIQKWVWKEVEITKTKFDDLCSPLFSTPPHEPSPSARGFIQHSRVFFKRASIIFEALNTKFSKLSESEKSRSIIIQGRVARQVRLYSAGIAFALIYNLLPINKLNAQLYGIVAEQFARRTEKARRFGKKMEIHSLIEEIIKSNLEEEIWQGKSAAEWYPPNDFKSFLPILLMVNITENAKLDLLGYYCLDLEMASITLGPEIEAKDGNTPPTLSIRAKRSSTSFNETSNHQPFRSQKFFSFFLAFFLQEDFSIDEMNRIRAVWNKDRESEIEVTPQPNLEQIKERMDVEKQLKWSILGNFEDIKKLKEECLKMEWGIYKFNEIMIERKKYNFLIKLPPLKGNEPEFVQKCHGLCMDVRRRFPSLFKETKGLPNFVMERYNNKVRQLKNANLVPLSLYPHQKQSILPMSVQHRRSFLNESNQPAIMPTQNLHEKRPSLIPQRSPLGVNLDESEEQFEEMPLTIATPRKRQCFALFESKLPLAIASGPVSRRSRSLTPPQSTFNGQENNIEKSPIICNIVQRGSVKEKDWQRITKVTQTPLSLRKSISQSRLPIRQQNRANFRDKSRTTCNADDQQSPEPNIAKPIQPPSILKSDKKQSRLPLQSSGERPKICFAKSLFTTEQIPSRAERANAERHDTSFTNFASLSANESSASSASAFQSGNGTEAEKVIEENNEKEINEVENEKEEENDNDASLSANESSALSASAFQSGNGTEAEKVIEENNEKVEIEVDNEEENEKEEVENENDEQGNNVEEEKSTGKKEILENSTTSKWLEANLREGPVLRRSTRARKTIEHFEPELSPPRRSPSRIERTPPIQERTPPVQTPPSNRKRGRPPSAQKKKDKSPSPAPQTPKKRGRHSTGRKDNQ